jgi:hypothetical protein
MVVALLSSDGDNWQQWNEFLSRYLSIDNREATELNSGIAAA